MGNKIHNIFDFYKFSNTKIINVAFGFALVLMVFLMSFTYARFSNYSDYADIVDHTQEVLNNIIKAGATHEKINSAQRSYLLTRKPKYITVFQEGTDSLKVTVATIEELTRDNPQQVKNAKKLDQLARDRITQLYVEVMNDTTTAKYHPTQERLLEKNQKKYDEFAELIQEMYLVERQLLSKRLSMKEFEARFTPVLLALTSFIALILLMMAFYLLNQELKERHRAEILLKDKVDELNLSNHHLEEFARVSSHDLKEPLRKISIFSDQLLQTYKGELPQRAGDMLVRINSSAIRMTDLIKDILDYSSLVSNERNNKEVVNLQTIWELILTDYSESIEEKKATITADTLPNIKAYRHQMYQLFQNLLSNALKFADVERTPVISLTYAQLKTADDENDGTVHQFIFADNGIGFDNQHAEKVFNVFGRLNRDQEGTGVGLAICKQVVENHDGEISVDSKEGVGSTFKIILPA